MQVLNKYFRNISLLLLLAGGLASCKKSFLEIVPKGRLVASKTADYDKLLTNLDLLNVNLDAQRFLGDEVAGLEPHFSGSALRSQRLFKWEARIYEQDQVATETSVPLSNIYFYNKIINEVMDSKDGSEQYKKSVRAEALAGRAWTYFMLINYYGKPYNEATSANDPGFPIVTEADVTENTFQRATVKQVWEFMVNDLTTAIPDLPHPITHRLRMSKAAGEALLGKVLIFMGKYNEAVPYLNDAVTHLSGSTIGMRLYDYNVNFAPGGAFLPIGAFGPAYPTAPNIEEVLYGKQYVNLWTGNELLLHPNAAALFGSSDLRLNFYLNTPYPSGAAFPNNMLRRIGPSTNHVGMLVPDLYLLRAEAKARTNDLSGAVTDLEYFRRHRMPLADAGVPSGVASNKDALIRFIIDERTREFAMQGYRWFDMRRLSVDPLFSGATYTHTVYAANGSVSQTFTLAPERFVLKLSDHIMGFNPQMENNP